MNAVDFHAEDMIAAIKPLMDGPVPLLSLTEGDPIVAVHRTGIVSGSYAGTSVTAEGVSLYVFRHGEGDDADTYSLDADAIDEFEIFPNPRRLTIESLVRRGHEGVSVIVSSLGRFGVWAIDDTLLSSGEIGYVWINGECSYAMDEEPEVEHDSYVLYGIV